MSISIDIKNIRNIKEANLELPFEKGMYGLVGGNGCGKSTLMLIMSLLIKTSSAHMITEKDTNEESQIIISADGKTDKWERNANNKMTTGKYKERRMIASAHYHGFYEGSIFYGSRFYDYQKINDFFERMVG